MKGYAPDASSPDPVPPEVIRLLEAETGADEDLVLEGKERARMGVHVPRPQRGDWIPMGEAQDHATEDMIPPLLRGREAFRFLWCKGGGRAEDEEDV